jgi:hypothetical protein
MHFTLREVSHNFVHQLSLNVLPIISFSTSLWCSSRICSRTSSIHLFNTPLSTVISNSSANHHLNADDTQLFLSPSAADFTYNISHLELTICNVYNWMSSNFLSPTPSETEFLLVGLPQQLSKLSNPIIHLPNNVIPSPVNSACNLGVIFDRLISLFLNKFLLFLNHASSIS